MKTYTDQGKIKVLKIKPKSWFEKKVLIRWQ